LTPGKHITYTSNMNSRYNKILKKIILVSVLLMFSCNNPPPICIVDTGVCSICLPCIVDVGVCHICLPCIKDVGVCSICLPCIKDKIPAQCTVANIETCVEACILEEGCFPSFSPKVCFRNCSTKCLNSFGCQWSKEKNHRETKGS